MSEKANSSAGAENLQLLSLPASATVSPDPLLPISPTAEAVLLDFNGSESINSNDDLNQIKLMDMIGAIVLNLLGIEEDEGTEESRQLWREYLNVFMGFKSCREFEWTTEEHRLKAETVERIAHMLREKCTHNSELDLTDISILKREMDQEIQIYALKRMILLQKS